MHKKWFKIFLITAMVVVALPLALVLPNLQCKKENLPLFERAREILLQNFTKTELGAKNTAEKIGYYTY